MIFHKIPALIFGSGALLCLWAFQQHIFLPRTVGWYAVTAALSLATWIFGVLTYRLTLHPLAKYPGPLLAALTDWYTVYWIAQGGRHLELNKQHMKYGKFVRFGPSRISTNCPHASRDLHSMKANTFKSDAYGSFKHFFGAEMSLTTVDHQAHKFRRRVNMTAITPNAVRSFEPQVTPHVDYFIQLMGQGAGTPADGEKGWTVGRDMSYAIAYCIADIMGSVTFGKTWNVQREDTYRKIVKELPNGVAGIHLVGHMQSLFYGNLHKLLFTELIEGVGQLMSIARSFALWRLDQGDNVTGDLCSVLIHAKDPETGKPYTREEIISEATLFIIGGTDGMITSTTGTLFYLLHNPETLARLTKEIRDAFPIPEGAKRTADSCPIRYASPELQEIKYLVACIDEAMRISPPVPSILPRRVGEGGIVIDGEFFPAGIDLGTLHYGLHRSEEFFPEPLTYAPERWLPEEREGSRFERDLSGLPKEGNQNSKAGVGHAPSFTPFGAGRGSCIGKFMAYQEMSYIIARLVWTFDIRLDPNSNRGEGTGNGLGRERKDEFQLLCRFVSSQSGPDLQFRYREDLSP